MKRIIFSYLYLIFCLNLQADEMNHSPWTWFYQKAMSDQEIQENKTKDELIFLRDNVDPFTQLLFSWNATRPEQGYFSFWVQSHDKRKQSWGMWHKMIEWGADVQRSFVTPSDNYAHYVHVRLEMEKNKLSDAFRIKIKAHEGASLSYLKNFSICLSDFGNFRDESAQLFDDLSSVYVHKVPKYSQFMIDHPRNDSLCSPTSSTILTSYLMQESFDPLLFAERSYDSGLGVYGSWPFNMAHAYELCKGNFWFAVARFNSFKYLHYWLEKNIPVVVSVRGPLEGAARPYAHGHLLVVIGFDAKKKEVICHDPAFETNAKTKKRYKIKDFLQAWERSKRLVYLAGPMIS